ncbi:hypothetical protein EMIT0P44_120061 [Pseudomonas sp. IT-P44]
MPVMAPMKSPSPASRAPTGFASSPNPEHPTIPCRSRLAGDGAYEIAIAGKPDSYRFCVDPQSPNTPTIPVGAGLLAMASVKSPSPASQAPTG